MSDLRAAAREVVAVHDAGDLRVADPSVIDRLRAALASEPPATGLDVEVMADDVRYAGGNGTSDYWRGFNDGIDRLAARLTEAPK